MNTEYIKGGYAIVPFSSDAPSLYADLMSAYTRGKAVMLTRFIRNGVLYPDQFVTVKHVNDQFDIDMIDVAHITVTSAAVTVTDSTVAATYTAGDGISISGAGVISVNYPNADLEVY